MEEVANASSAVANPAPAPATPPAPAPAAAPTSSPSSESSGSFIDVLKKDAVFITFGILGATALFYLIYYYKYNTQTAKGFQTSFQNQLDELKIEISDLKSIDNKTNASIDGGLFVNSGGFMEQW